MSENKSFVVHHHQKAIQLKATKLSFYRQAEIVEAENENGEIYYLFFYKYQFLNAVKVTKLRLGSFIARAFKEGIVFTNAHPFFDQLLSSNKPYKLVPLQTLLMKLEKRYTPHEKAFILTFFESFYPKKTLYQQIKSIFYEYRRNGQMFLGYRIIRILMDFAPKSSFVKGIAHDMSFRKYAALYDEKSEELYSKDALFAEKVFYEQKDNDENFQLLQKILKEDSRWMDVMSLYGYKLQQTPSEQFYVPLQNLLDEYLNENEQLIFLEQLTPEIPTFVPLLQDLFTMYLETNQLEKALPLMNNEELRISKTQMDMLSEMLEKLNMDSTILDPTMLQRVLTPVISKMPEKAESLLHKYVSTLLTVEEPSYIKEWLKPFKQQCHGLNIYEQIEVMNQACDDLENMQKLGELFYEFHQMEKAIECFSWEMELKPSDPKPLQWLSKVYGDMGKTYEADVYRKLCIDLQKLA